MDHSDERFSLHHLLQQASISDPSLSLHLVGHCVELLGDLTRNLLLDLPPSESDKSEDSEDDQPASTEGVDALVQPLSVLPEYGDEAPLAQARSEALEVFDSRLFEMYCYIFSCLTPI